MNHVRAGSQGKSIRAVLFLKKIEPSILNVLPEVQLANSFEGTIKEKGGQQKISPQKPLANQSKLRARSHLYNVGGVVRHITTKTIHNEGEVRQLPIYRRPQ